VRRSAAFAFEELSETREHASKSVVRELKLAIPALVSALTDSDKMVRGNAAEALVQIGAEAIPFLMIAVEGKDHRLRTAAEEVLKQIKAR
jgi:HEAT repeat protein